MRNKCFYITIASELLFGTLFLVFGCAIYLLFRSKTLNIYKWCSQIGISDYVDSARLQVQHWSIPPIVKFSIPDGLYCAAYILIIDAILQNNNGLIKDSIVLFIPFTAICHEIFQYYGIIKGTFDIYDLTCYVLPSLFYFIKSINKINFKHL